MSLQQPTPAVQYCTCPHLSQQLALQATHVLAAAPGPRPGPAVMGVESSGGGPGGMEQARPKKKKKLSEAEAEAEVLRSHSSSSKWVYACVHCSYSGHKDDEHFRDHCSADNGGSGCGSGHSVVVDVVNRELYCMQCQDYQYHDVFDRLVNHCRPGKDFMHQRRKIPLGIVNMGSTCFMSSVLQLLLSSPALVRFFEISECFVVKCKINEVENSTGKNMLCIFCELQKVFLSTNSPMCPREVTMEKGKSGSKKQGKALSTAAGGLNGSAPLVPSSLLYAVWSYARHLASYDQQDAHEFLLALLDGLGAHLQKYHGDLNAAIAMKGGIRPPHLEDTPSSSSLPSITIPTEYSGDVSAVPVPVRRVVHSPRSHVVSASAHDNQDEFVNMSGAATTAGGGVTPRSGSTAKTFGSPSSKSNQSETLYEFRGIVNEVFSGVLSSDLICQTCGHTSTTYDPFLDLSLSLDDIQSGVNVSHDSADETSEMAEQPTPTQVNPVKTIHDCFVEFTSAEELHQSMECSNCKVNSKVSKKLNIQTPPNVLIIHMKRFDITLNGGEIECVKINKPVEFPMYGLDLMPFIKSPACDVFAQGLSCTSSSRVATTEMTPHNGRTAEAMMYTKIESERLSSKSCHAPSTPDGREIRNTGFNDAKTDAYGVLYDLSGVVCHKGKSLTQGHYISYVKKEMRLATEDMPVHCSGGSTISEGIKDCNGTSAKKRTKAVWLKCDDEAISEVEEEEVHSAEGYLLFYVRRTP